MGTTLTGKRVQNTYDSLLKLSDNDNLTGVAKIVGDGLGNDSPIYLSTSKIGIGVSPTYQFQTSGDGKIGGSLIVAGNLTVNGTTTIVDSTIVAIGDNMIELAKDNAANTMDIGWYGTIVESGTKYVGTYYDAGSGVTTPTFYIGLGTSEPSSTAAWTVKGKLVIGQLDATGGTITGNLSVTGTIADSDGDVGTSGQVLSSTGSGTNYVDQDTIYAGSAERTEILVKNVQGSALVKGDPIYIVGGVGASARLEVGLCDASDSSKMPCVGLLSQNLANNGEGYAIVTGKLRNLVTSPIDGVTPTENDTIYVKPNSSSGAALTTTKPTATNHLIQNVGQVGRVSTSADGNLVVSAIMRTNDVPNEVDRDLSIAGNLKVDDYIEVEADSGFGYLEVGGPAGGYIDLKTPFSDDYDLRFITGTNSISEITASSTLRLNAGNTLTLTLDGSTQAATFAGEISANKRAVITTDGTYAYGLNINSGDQSHARIRITNTGVGGETYSIMVGTHGVSNAGFAIRNETDSTTPLQFDTSDNATFAGDITVSGGDITLGGTGRIQGVDTVSAGTDAANKDYVDNAVGGKVDGSGTANYIPKWSDSNTLTNSNLYDNGSITQCFDTFGVYKTGPVIILSDTDATTTTNQVGYISMQINGTESGWIGFGSSGNNEFGIRNTSGPIVLNPSTLVETKQYLKINNVGGDRKIEFNRTGGNQFSIEHDSSQIYFYNASTGKSNLLIENGGQVFINPGLVASNALKVYYDMKLYNTLNLTDSSFNIQSRIYGSNGALGLSASSQTVVYINSSHNVGIGATTDIHSLLTLSGNTNSYTTAPIISFNSTNTVSANVRNWAIGPADSNYGNFHIFKSSARGESAISTAESVMVIDYTGKVGIGVGTYTVSETLDVHGNAYLVGVGSALKFDTTGANGSNGIKTINDYETLIYNGRGAAGHVVVGNSNIRLGFGTNYTNAEADVIINTTGIVLIGTDTVAYAGTDLHIGNTSDTQNGIQIQTSTTGYGYVLFGDGSGASAYRGQVTYSHSDDKMYFNTAGATRFEILSSGDGVFNYNLGVGISPTYDLDVNGVGAFGTGNYRTYVHGDGNGSFIEFGTNADNDALGVLGTFASSMIFDTNQGLGFKWRYAGGQKMRLTTGGFLGVGVDPSTLLHLKSTSPIITIEDSDLAGDHGIDFVPTGYTSRGSIFMNYTNAELRYSAGISSNTYFQSFYTNGTERARFTSGGKFLVECTESVTTAKIGIRQNGSSIEFGHDNQTYGYYGTLGATYSSGHPFIAFSCYNNSTVGGNNFATQGHKGNVIYGNSAGDLTFGQATIATSSSQGLTTRMILKNSGYLGIGIVNPSYKTVISNGGAEGIEFGPGYASGRNLWQNYNRSTSVYVEEWHYASKYVFNVDATERVRILNSNMTGGWDETLRISNQYPVLSFKSDVGPGYYAGLAYDGGYGLRFYLGASSVDITGTGTHAGFADTAGRWVLGAGSTSTTGAYALTIAAVNGTYTSAINFKHGSNQFFVGHVSVSTTTNVELWNAANGYIRFGTNSSEKMKLDSAGHLTINDGVFSASDGRTLQVVNSAASVLGHVSYDTVLIQQTDAPTLRIYESGDDIATTISSDVIYSTIATTDNLRFYTNGSSTQTAYNGLVGTHVMTMDTSGKVLIGQTSSLTSATLQVKGYVDITKYPVGAFRIYDGTTFVGGMGDGQWAFGSSGYASNLSLYAQDNLLLHAGSGSTIDLFIRSNHRIGSSDDGTVFSPSTRLHLKDVSDAQLTLEGRSNTWAGIFWKDVNGSAYTWFYGSTQTWAFGGGGSAVSGKRIHCDGGMTIGANYDSVTMPTNGLWVQGTIKCADDLVAFDSSDKRLKDNIRKIEKPLEKLDKINGYKFKWNTKQDIHEGEDYGVIAQEVEEIMPEIVNLKESGYYGVKYDKLIPLLIESVKELKAEIRDLKKCNCNCK